MTGKQMEMYKNGMTSRLVAEAHAYEEEQWRKAFIDGSQTAWRQYRANVRRKVARVNKITGVGLDADRMMR